MCVGGDEGKNSNQSIERKCYESSLWPCNVWITTNVMNNKMQFEQVKHFDRVLNQTLVTYSLEPIWIDIHSESADNSNNNSHH